MMDTPTQLAPIVAWGRSRGVRLRRSRPKTICTMGAVSDWVNMTSTRLRMWLLAIGVAIPGRQRCNWPGWWISPNPSTRGRTHWLSYGVGGFLFGVGFDAGAQAAARRR
jgi:hypothetical protein